MTAFVCDKTHKLAQAFALPSRRSGSFFEKREQVFAKTFGFGDGEEVSASHMTVLDQTSS
jgi:hypothetical protein